MEKFITATGKTIDLAIEAALKELQMDRDSVSVEVLENPKSGFLGIGAVPAKVKVTYEVPDEEVKPAPALSSASRSKPKKQEPKTEPLKPLNPINPKPRTEAPKADAPKAEAPKQERRPEAPKQPRPEKRQAPKEDRAPAPKAPVREYAPAAPGSVEERIETFIKGLLEHMGSDAVPHAWKTSDDTYQVDLVGEDLGMLIGRRGETLDAIQHLTNYSINRDSNKRSRVNVDAENYRQKREESLQHLARKVAGKVVKYRRNITLEPMNAYERHVIHAALQDVPDVTTFSTGTEPNRRVVVAYSRYPQQNEKN
ncbi:MAG: RNA-binding cell elongation regulator Jag/EloR [Candidatus Avoscillospira sp.]